MNLNQVKEIIKFSVDNSTKRFNNFQKEIIKIAIDNSKSLQEIFFVVATIKMIY